jgi:hypothetical protein
MGAQGDPYTATISGIAPLCVPIWFIIIQLFGKYQQRHLVAKQDKFGEEMAN